MTSLGYTVTQHESTTLVLPRNLKSIVADQPVVYSVLLMVEVRQVNSVDALEGTFTADQLAINEGVMYGTIAMPLGNHSESILPLTGTAMYLKQKAGHPFRGISQIGLRNLVVCPQSQQASSIL